MNIYYDSEGKEHNDVIEDACAYKVERDRDHICWIKMCSIGRDSGRVFDPRLSKDFGYNKRNIWVFRKVTPQAFSLYVRFLKTRHGYLLVNAERNI